MSEAEPVLRVVRGEPTDDEVAALVIAVRAVADGAPAGQEPRPRSRWADRAVLVRAPLRPGPGAWRASGR